MSEKDTLKKLNIGCGGTVLPGWINLDSHPYPHLDIKYDLESGLKLFWSKHPESDLPCGDMEIEVPDNYFDRMLMSHVFEHIRNPLPMMQELWRVAKPGCKLAIITPYGSSDNAWEDPTHVRAVYMDTYMYFSQCWYGKNDYGYRGDWHFKKRVLLLNKEFFTQDATDQQIGYTVQHMRNVVVEFQAELIAVKPMRVHPFDYETPQTAFKFA